MKILIYGAGTLGCLYAHRLFESGADVTILARGAQYDFIRQNGVVLVNEFSGELESSPVPVVDSPAEDAEYDLVIVLIRKNLQPPVIELLGRRPRIGNILFMGNNALGFASYREHLPRKNLLFGFPGAGGSREQGVVHYVDSEKPRGGRIPVTLGGSGKGISRVRSLFESADVPVNVVADMDGWLKYHVALVSPLANALRMHDCDNQALAADTEGLRLFVRACREGGDVLRALGYRRRQPFKWNLFYWLPETVTVGMFRKVLESRFAEIAYARHARAAADEMRTLDEEFRTLIDRASLATPHIDRLRAAAGE